MSKKIFNLIFALLLSLTTLSPVYAEDEAPEPTGDTSQEIEETPTPENTSYTEEGFFDIKETPEYIEEGDFVVEEVSPTVEEIVYYCNKEEHTHSDECFDNYRVLICEDESEEHKHNEECFKEYSFMICEKEEHIHDENCLDENYEEPIIEVDEVALEQQKQFEELLNKALNEEDGYFLNCEKIEHTHTPECFEYKEDLICEKEEILDKEDKNYHIHTDECYEKYYIIICEEKEEHTHTMDCISQNDLTHNAEGLIEYIDEIPDDLPKDEDIPEDAPLRTLLRAPLRGSNDTQIEVRQISVQVFQGGSWQGSKYVKNVPNNATGQRFAFRVNFAISGVGEVDPYDPENPNEGVKLTIPKKLLRNRLGNLADRYEMSIPHISEIYDEEMDSDIHYAYYEENDNIVIVNFHERPAGDNGYFEIAYATTENIMNYRDMDQSDDFFATIEVNNNGQTATAESNRIPVFMNTHAKINSTTKSVPAKYNTWNSAWGEAPADAEDWFYLLWDITSYIDKDTSQPYTLTFVDNTTSDYGESVFVSYRFRGEQTYTTTDTIQNQTITDRRYDSVLTKHKKSDFEGLDYYTIKNNIQVTLTPEDGLDAKSVVKGSNNYVYKYHVPTFTYPTGHFEGYKYADGSYRAGRGYNMLSLRRAKYSRYDLQDFKDSTLDVYDTFDWGVEMHGYPYPWTIAEGADWKDVSNFGQTPVQFILEDNTFFFGTDGKNFRQLTYEDYEIDKINYGWNKIRDANLEYATNSQGDVYPKYNSKIPAYNKETDIIYFYVEKEGTGGYQLVATHDLRTHSLWSDPQYVTDMTSGVIELVDNITGYKVFYESSYYYTQIETVLNAHLKHSEYVDNYLLDKTVLEWGNTNHVEFIDNRNNSVIYSKNNTDWNYASETIVERDSYIAKKTVSATNVVKKKQYRIGWQVYMDERMKINDGPWEDVPQESGVFYDLLPSGSTLDVKSVAVKHNGNSSGVSTWYGGTYLDENQYMISTIPNYKNSGRTLLIVKINEPSDNFLVYYDTIHSWDSIKDYGTNVYNPVAYETGNDKIYNGYPNNGGTIKDKTLMSDLGDNGNDKPKFIYSQSVHNILALTSAVSGLTKKVKDERDKNYSYDTVTTNNGSYSYRLRYQNQFTNTAKNLIFFDSLENFIVDGDPSDWFGAIESFDLLQLQSKGINPVVYVSTIPLFDLEQYSVETDFDAIFANGGTWIELGNYQGDYADIKAYAIDCRKKTDGSDFVLAEGESISATIYMRAPSGANDLQGTDYPETYNNIYIRNTITGTDGEPQDFYIHQDYTTVRFVVTGNISLEKVSAENSGEKLKDIKFRLTGVSDYGTSVDEILATDKDGKITFKDIEKGSYILQEYETTKDWLLDTTEHHVLIDSQGRTWVDEQDITDLLVQLSNNPRIYADIPILKRREGDSADDVELKQRLAETNIGDMVEYNGETYIVKDKTDTKVKLEKPTVSDNGLWVDYTIKPQTPIANTTFKLSGTSDYGNDANLILKTDSVGKLTFDNIEKGTYELREITQNTDFILNETVWDVVVGEDRSITINSQEENRDRLYEVTKDDTQRYNVIFNEPRYWSFTLRKVDKENETIWLEGAKFKLSGISDLGTEYDLEAESNSNGRVVFDRIEKGTYILKESEAPSGVDENGNIGGNRNYIADNKTYIVTINHLGEVKIEGLTENVYDDFVVKNERALDGKITITKIWNDVDPSKRVAPKVHISTGEPEGLARVQIIYDANGGYFENNNSSINKVVYKGDVVDGAFVGGLAEGEILEPVKDEFVFSGWYLDKDCATPYTENISVGKSKKVYAKWEKNEAYAVYDSSNETLTFFRDEPGKYTNSQVEGTKRYYTGIETTEYDDSYGNGKMVPWYGKELTYFFEDNISPVSTVYWFYKSVNIVGLEKLDTSNVTNMGYMFQSSKATLLDLSNFNTSNVTSMHYMFYNSAATSLDLSSFDTSNVTDMSCMFRNSKATSLDLSSFDTSNVTNMGNMFNESAATSLDLSSFNTSNVTSMGGMFYRSKATSLDLSSFNTSKVTGMGNMFAGSKATSLDLSNFDTSNVTGMPAMFEYCVATSITIGDNFRFKGKNITAVNGQAIFPSSMYTPWTNSEKSLRKTSAQLRNSYDTNAEAWSGTWTRQSSTASLTDNNPTSTNLLSSRPEKSENLLERLGLYTKVYAEEEDIDSGVYDGVDWRITAKGELIIGKEGEVQEFTYSGRRFSSDYPWYSKRDNINSIRFIGIVKGSEIMENMFRESQASSIDLTNFDTSNVTNMGSMFSGSQATSLDLSSFDTSNVTDMSAMFWGSQATSLDLSSFDTSSVTSMNGMFIDSRATSLDLSSFNTSNVTDMGNMFAGSQATLLDLSSFDTSNVKSMYTMFAQSQATLIKGLNKFNTSNVTDMSSMFWNSQATLLDLSSFDTSKAIYMNSMFSGFKATTIVFSDKMLGNNDERFKNTNLSGDWIKVIDKNGNKLYDQTVYTGEEVRNLNETTTPTLSGTWMNKSLLDPTSNPDGTYTWTTVDSLWTDNGDGTWTYTFDVFDDNLTYYFWEENLEGYESDIEWIPGYKTTVNKQGVITNTSIELGSLEITKTVLNGETNNKFDFTITLSGNGISGQQIFSNVVFTDGVGKIKLGKDESKLIEGLPAGVTYIVEEAPYSDYITTSTGETGTIVANETQEVSFRNKGVVVKDLTAESGFKVKKVVEGNNEVAETFDFIAQINAGEPNKLINLSNGESITTDASGLTIYEFSLANNEELIFSNLSTGATYQVTEKAGEYISSYNIQDLNEGNSINQSANENTTQNLALSTAVETLDIDEEIEITFTNKIIKKQNLKVTKQVDGNAEDKAKQYEITVELYGLDPMTTLDSDAGRFVADEDGYAIKTILLRDGEEFMIPEIPVGTQYVITESPNNTYAAYEITDANGGSNFVKSTDSNNDINLRLATQMETVNENEEATVHFTNTSGIDLNITKLVDGNMGNKSEEFEFTLKIYESFDKYVMSDFTTVLSGRTPTYTNEEQAMANELFTAYYDSDKYLNDNRNYKIIELPQSYIDQALAAISAGNYEYNGEKIVALARLIRIGGGGPSGGYRSTYVEYRAAFIKGYMKNNIDSLSQEGLTPIGNNTYSFILTHGDTLTIKDIYYGYDYEIEEIDYSNEGYRTYVNNGMIQSRKNKGTLSQDREVTFRNIRGAAVPTEIRFWWWSGIPLILIPILYIIMKERKKKQLSKKYLNRI